MNTNVSIYATRNAIDALTEAHLTAMQEWHSAAQERAAAKAALDAANTRFISAKNKLDKARDDFTNAMKLDPETVGML